MRRLFLFSGLIVLLFASGCSRDPKVVSRKYVDTGKKYFAKEKYREASIMYKRALQKDPLYADAWYQLGVADLRLGPNSETMQEAARAFQRASQLDPNNADASVQLANLYLASYLQNPNQGKQVLEEVRLISNSLLKKDPKSFDGLRLKGYVALAERDVLEAIKAFEGANQVKPNQPDLVLALVQALLAANRAPEAEQLALATINQHKQYGPLYDILYSHDLQTQRLADAENLLKRKIENNPKNSDYILQLAFHYYLTNRRGEMAATLLRITQDPKTYPKGHLQVGDFYLKTRDFDQALKVYREGETVDTADRPAYDRRMAEILAMQGKTDEATKLLTQVLNANSKDSDAIAMRAALMVQRGNRDELKKAIGDLQPLVTKNPKDPMLHFNLGRAYMANRDLDQARQQLQDALKLSPNYIPAKLTLAQLLLTKGENANAVSLVDEVLKADPSNIAARLIRTLGLMNMGEGTRAREDLNTILAKNPKLNDARYQLGLLDFSERKYKEAEANFQILRDANDPRGLIGIVECRAARGDYDGAIGLLQGDLNQNPNRADYRLALANLQANARRYPDAVANYQHLIDANPKGSDLYVRKGDAQRLSGDLNGAITSFQKAHELNGTDVKPLIALALIYDSQGRREDSRKAYENVLKVEPDNPIALNNLAFMKADEGVDLDQALTYAQKAQQKLTANTDVRDTLSLIYLRKNLTDDALRMLRDLVKAQPDRATFRLHLAMALYQKGDKDGARRELEMASKNKPSPSEQTRIKEMMAKV